MPDYTKNQYDVNYLSSGDPVFIVYVTCKLRRINYRILAMRNAVLHLKSPHQKHVKYLVEIRRQV